MAIYGDLEKAMQKSIVASKVITVGSAAPSPICYRNIRRLALIILPDKTNTLAVSLNGTLTGTAGGVVPTTSGGVFITMKDYGDAVRAQWDGVGQGANCTITVIEVLACYDPDTE